MFGEQPRDSRELCYGCEELYAMCYEWKMLSHIEKRCHSLPIRISYDVMLIEIKVGLFEKATLPSENELTIPTPRNSACYCID